MNAVFELDVTETEAENIHLDLSRLNAESIWNCGQLERLTAKQFALWLCPTALMPKNEDFEQEILLTVRIGISRWNFFEDFKFFSFYRIVDKLSGKRLTYEDQEFQLKFDSLAGHKIWLESNAASGPILIHVNESTPPGAMIWNCRAGISHSSRALRKKIRYYKIILLYLFTYSHFNFIF